MTFTALIAIYFFSSFIGTCLVACVFGLSSPLQDRRIKDRRVDVRLGQIDRRASYNVPVKLETGSLIPQE